MPLFGHDLTDREIAARLPRPDVAAGLRRVRLSGGPEDGVEQIEVRTGGGLAYRVSASRGLDIALAEFAGVPFSWHSPAGDVHPAHLDPREAEWLRTMAGGLLMTCGLTQVGSPCVDDGEPLGIHGRAHHLPARSVCAESVATEDGQNLRVSGVVEDTGLFQHALRLEREIVSRVGENRLEIRDRVTNVGFAPAPHMHLYHINFGWPLLDEHARIGLPEGTVAPREADLVVEDLDRWQGPEVGFAERVYYRENMKAENDGLARASVHQPAFPVPGTGGGVPVTVELSWDPTLLPVLVQWRMPGAGVYGLGLEPGNCHVEGRVAERERGTLVTLEPGESRDYTVSVTVQSGDTPQSA